MQLSFLIACRHNHLTHFAYIGMLLGKPGFLRGKAWGEKLSAIAKH